MNLLAGLFSISLSVRRLSALIGGTTFARMILMTVLPLKALEVMGGPQFVSGTYFVVGCVAIERPIVLQQELVNVQQAPIGHFHVKKKKK